MRSWVLALPCKLFPLEQFSERQREHWSQTHTVELGCLTAQRQSPACSSLCPLISFLRCATCSVLSCWFLFSATDLVHLLVNYFKHIFGYARFQESTECNH